MAENKIKLSKADRRSVMLRSQFLQGSWNYERMQNGGWAYSLIPALKKLYPKKEDASAALPISVMVRSHLRLRAGRSTTIPSLVDVTPSLRMLISVSSAAMR